VLPNKSALYSNSEKKNHSAIKIREQPTLFKCALHKGNGVPMLNNITVLQREWSLQKHAGRMIVQMKLRTIDMDASFFRFANNAIKQPFDSPFWPPFLGISNFSSENQNTFQAWILKLVNPETDPRRKHTLTTQVDI
jgi:hypothetical protein